MITGVVYGEYGRQQVTSYGCIVELPKQFDFGVFINEFNCIGGLLAQKASRSDCLRYVVITPDSAYHLWQIDFNKYTQDCGGCIISFEGSPARTFDEIEFKYPNSQSEIEDFVYSRTVNQFCVGAE